MPVKLLGALDLINIVPSLNKTPAGATLTSDRFTVDGNATDSISNTANDWLEAFLSVSISGDLPLPINLNIPSDARILKLDIEYRGNVSSNAQIERVSGATGLNLRSNVGYLLRAFRLVNINISENETMDILFNFHKEFDDDKSCLASLECSNAVVQNLFLNGTIDFRTYTFYSALGYLTLTEFLALYETIGITFTLIGRSRNDSISGVETLRDASAILAGGQLSIQITFESSFSWTLDPPDLSGILPGDLITITSDDLLLDDLDITIGGVPIVPIINNPGVVTFEVPPGLPEGPIEIDATDPKGTQFSGSILLGTLIILGADVSGIYVLELSKKSDTLYNSDRSGSTVDRTIPTPFIETGFVGG